jgi:replication initiation and membrane attachment protein DnaB
MRVNKQLIDPRVRQIPHYFSWVDRKLVRRGYIEQCSHQAAALYLFLITVADERGLSFYSDQALTNILRMHKHNLRQAREQLILLGMIAYQAPLYQVLALEEGDRCRGGRR